MRKSNCIYLLVYIVGIILLAFNSSFAAELETELVNKKYEKQGTFTCNKHKFKIPLYFPNGDNFVYNNKPPASDLYLTANEKECKPDNFRVILGLDPDCNGSNVCLNAEFSYRKIGNISEAIDSDLLSNAKKVKLSKKLVGYFRPSECGANCSPASITWFTNQMDNHKIFIIETRSIGDSKKVIIELVKSANSYINSQK